MNTLASCQLCGSTVNINGSLGVCQGCGVEYDVIKHGRRDFKVSAEVAVNAQKKPSDWIGPSLILADGTSAIGTTQYIGTKIRIWGKLVEDIAPYVGIPNRSIRIMGRLGAGVWAKVTDATTDASGYVKVAGADYWYTLGYSGTNTFRLEWDGDATYLGCESKADGLKASDYAVSSEVSVEAQPALTIIVKDMIFKKPIEGARVVIDTSEAITDASGMAVFDALAPGTYTLTVSAKDYKSETRTVELTTLGMVVEIHLIHMAALALGIVGAGAVGIVVAHKALKRK